jgi:hypothetical protein
VGRALRRNLGAVSCLEPGEYTVETATGGPALCCPSSGGVSDLDFEVHRGGRVSQIWSCPFASCSFVDYLDLEAWGEEVLR